MTEATDCVDLKTLKPGSHIDVETRSRHYQIECLGGNAVRVSGHPEICPYPVAAQIQGSIDKEGDLESGLIGSGMRLLFFLKERGPVTTSKVVSVHVDQPNGVQSKGAPSIH